MNDEPRRPSRVSPALLALGVVLIAINLRPAAASIGPVLTRIQSDTGLSSGGAGALTTLPVLCFGLLAPLAPVLARRLGMSAALAGAMAALLAGILIRLIPGVGFLFAGTALAGAAIATGNVLLPVVVRRDFPHRTGLAMAMYTTALIGFAALAAGITVPVANALGGGWRPGLAIWALPAAVAALAWLPALLRRAAAPPRQPRPAQTAPARPPTIPAGPPTIPARSPTIPARPAHTARALLRDPLAWQVTLFFALQSGNFYATLAWLPSIFHSQGATEGHAGLLLSLSMIVGLAAALALPGIAARHRDHRPLVVFSCALTAIGLAGILIAPMSAAYLWVVLLGLGQNAAFPLALMMIVMRGGTVAGTEGLSTLAQAVGYGLAALAPLAVGAVHGATGSWTPPLVLLLVLVVPELVLGLAAGRDRRLSVPAGTEPAGTEPAPARPPAVATGDST